MQLTYQDLIDEKVGTDEEARMKFVRRAIAWHCGTDLYKDAVDAWEYFCCRNKTIREYEKTMVNALGQIVPDRFSPNHKSASNFFNVFITQLSQYLLANGPGWTKSTHSVQEGTEGAVKTEKWDDEQRSFVDDWILPGTDMKLGRDFDTRLAEAGRYALIGGVSFGFWDSKRLNVFKITEFVPLFDEENGSLSAGIKIHLYF